MHDPDPVGLCLGCHWMRSITNRRGSTFYRCGRADSDPTFPRYPPLPVRQCRGYEAERRSAAGGGAEAGEAS